jgi:hypothetical protein
MEARSIRGGICPRAKSTLLGLGSVARPMAGADGGRSVGLDPDRGGNSMNSRLRRAAGTATAAATLVAVLAGCEAGGTSSAGTPTAARAQPVTVSAREYKLQVRGVGALRPGYARFTIRNEGRGEHGIELIRLRRALTTRALLEAFEREQSNTLEALGGAISVPPGKDWAMTVELGAGDYALLDYGENGGKVNLERGMFKRFRVAGRPLARAGRPHTVGTLAMRDFGFDVNFPRRFSGRGTIAIPNRGRAFHEVSLVRIQPGHTQNEVLRLIKEGQGSPPRWASVVELLGVLGPRRSAYVRLHLRPGRYVALCLIDDPKSGRLHADLGMISTFDVSKRG